MDNPSTSASARKAPPSAEAATPAPIRVRAKRLGFCDNVRRKPGDEFTVASVDDLGTWMERIDGGENPAVERAAAAARPSKKR